MNLSSTRRALHGAAELLLAGPQHRHSGTINFRHGKNLSILRTAILKQFARRV